MKHALAALAGAAVLAWTSSAVADPPWASPAPRAITLEQVAKIKVGHSTTDQVKALLGAPLRMRSLADDPDDEDFEVWEYQGRDASGSFIIHIEFSDEHIARLVAKDTRKGPIVILAVETKPKTAEEHH